jgi:hypothetical protein
MNTDTTVQQDVHEYSKLLQVAPIVVDPNDNLTRRVIGKWDRSVAGMREILEMTGDDKAVTMFDLAVEHWEQVIDAALEMAKEKREGPVRLKGQVKRAEQKVERFRSMGVPKDDPDYIAAMARLGALRRKLEEWEDQ